MSFTNRVKCVIMHHLNDKGSNMKESKKGLVDNNALAAKSTALVNTLNIISSEDAIAFGMLRALKQSPFSSKFFTLFYEAIPNLSCRLRDSDLRTQGSKDFLSKLSTPTSITYPLETLEAFSKGITNNHPTLIQSFFRVFRHALYLSQSDISYINAAKQHARSERATLVTNAMNELLNSLEALPSPINGIEKLLVDNFDQAKVSIPFV